MNNDVLVSIVVPIYNIEQYVGRCVHSIVNQYHRNLEVILVDDGSQDGSPQICDEFAKNDTRIIVIHQENKGLGMARNAGLDIFKGQWLCFVDGDDFIHENYVETLLDIALKNDCLISSCGFTKGVDDKFPISLPSDVKVFNMRDYVYFWLLNCYGSACGSIFHYSILKEFRFSPIRIAEDVASMHNLVYAARKKKYAVTKQPMYYYYQRPQSLLGNIKNSNYFLYKDACFEWLRFWQEKGEKEIEELCWQCSYSRLVSVVTETSRDIPQYKENISEITEFIKNGFPRAISYGNIALDLSLGAKKSYYSLLNSGKKYILYGFGTHGNELLPWLKYFKINVCEIFDKKANNTETAFDIPVKQAHAGLTGEDTVVIISVEEQETQMNIRNMLREIGYNNFIGYHNIYMALRYAAYEKFLPFLLES